jgi:hypothetical protein
MVSKKSIEQQLKRIHFNHLSWGRSEVRELPGIILPDEVILECVNGMYEGGFALLVATDTRVLLVDKKPLNYLTVEDLRFDMISEIDYSHRLFGARINISTGSKTLTFTSYNQPRLRKLIGFIQHHMADLKKVQNNHQQDQKQHLEQINQQLQAYLIAQHKQQETLMQQLDKQSDAASVTINVPDPIKPSPELADYLFAQRLLQEQGPLAQAAPLVIEAAPQPELLASPPQPQLIEAEIVQPAATSPVQEMNPLLADLYAEGMQEIFGRSAPAAIAPIQPPVSVPQPTMTPQQHSANVLEINPMKIAYSKLPMALRNRKFGRPSFHAHSQSQAIPLTPHTTVQL